MPASTSRRPAALSGPRGTVSRTRSSASCSTGFRASRDNSAASRAAWLYRRRRNRFTCSGTGASTSARCNNFFPARAISIASPRERSVRSAYLNGKISPFAIASYRNAARAIANAGGAASHTPQISENPAAAANGSGTPQLAHNGADTKFARRKQGKQNCPSAATGASHARQDGGSKLSSTANPTGFNACRRPFT